MTFDEHISDVVSSCIASLCHINRVKHIFDKRTIVFVTNALISSKMYYCSSFWSSTWKNFAARIVTVGRKFDHVTPILKNMQWLSVGRMMAYKCMKGLAPPCPCDKFLRRSDLHSVNVQMT